MIDTYLRQLINGIQEVIRDLPLYFRGHLRSDAVAGLTVAVMGVPQAMAYALIAGLPPVYGLYTAIVTCSLAAVTGSSSHLVTGPTNALCMVMLSLTAHMPLKYEIGLLETVLLLTFMTGAIQLSFGLLRMGGIVRYVSNSVVVGFTAGAGILIAANQLKNILDVEITTHSEEFIVILYSTLKQIPHTNPYAFGVGILTAAAVVFLPRIDRRIPGPLLGIIVTGSLVYFLQWHLADKMGAFKVDIVRDIEPIKGTLDIFHFPDLILHPNWELTRELGAGALALALLGLIEAASIARAVASQSGQRLNFTREFIGQGAGNMVGSFFSCFAGSGSFTRTAVCFKSGGSTRMAAVFSALWTALTLLLLAPLANFIPKASLAGILIVIAYSMIDKHRLMLAWRSSSQSRLVLFGTLFSTLVLPLEYAIFVGVFLSVFLLLRVTGKTDLTQLVPRSDSGFDEVPFNRAAPSPVVTVNLEGDLYFAAAEDLDYELLRCLTRETRVVVLRMKRLRAVGSTAMAILEHFWELLETRNITLVVCGIEHELEKVMTGSGVRAQIGEQNIFYADNKLFQSTELALARAWSIVHQLKQGGEEISAVEMEPQYTGITAGDIMSARSIRFGNQHQLREAFWLMSEMMKRSKSINALPLFLQDKEGKLAGVLSTWRILREIKEGLDSETVSTMDDQALGTAFRKHFTKSISTIARTDLEHIEKEATLGQLVKLSVEKNLQVLPVCEADGRISGRIDQHDLLKGLGKALNLMKEKDG